MYDCWKCGGSGNIPVFRHVEGGVCFVCGGAKKLAYRRKPKVEKDPHPEKLVPEARRSTDKQWKFLTDLVDDNDTKFCEFVHKAGGVATQRYLDKATMSRAIELALAAKRK